MNVRSVVTLVGFLAGSAVAQEARAEDQPLGLISKVILEVSRKPSGNGWEKAQRGQPLSSGDMLRTGARSFAVVKFKDNSLVRVRELSEVMVTGTQKDRSLSKSVTVQQGGVGFNITKQKPEEEFRFSSPTSVASIRGTGGLFTVGTDDTLTLIEGSLLLVNLVSSESTLVTAGFTAISSKDGRIDARPATDGEIRTAQEAMKSGDRPRQLRMQLRGPQGEARELILDFKE